MLDQAKLDWLKSIGAKEFKHPMKWAIQGGEVLFSEEYVANTPLEMLQAGYEGIPKKGNSLNFTTSFNVGSVRNDIDIENIANEIYRLQKQGMERGN